MRSLIDFLKPYRKAIVSGLVAGAFAAIPLVADGNVSSADVSLILGALLTGAGVTYKVPNAALVDPKHKAGKGV